MTVCKTFRIDKILLDAVKCVRAELGITESQYFRKAIQSEVKSDRRRLRRTGTARPEPVARTCGAK